MKPPPAPVRALAAAALLLSGISLPASAQSTQTLLATPSTVAWGYYSATAKPALAVHSGDTVVMQTASTCGSPKRLETEGVKPADIPTWLGTLYDGVPQADRGPGGHILTGPASSKSASTAPGPATASVRDAVFCPTTSPTAGPRSSRSTAPG